MDAIINSDIVNHVNKVVADFKGDMAKALLHFEHYANKDNCGIFAYFGGFIDDFCAEHEACANYLRSLMSKEVPF